MRLISDRPQVEGPATLVQPATPGQGLSRRNNEKAQALGLNSATGLVIGSIVGTGVFAMPAVLVGAGTMGIAVLGVIAVGAMLFATLFADGTVEVALPIALLPIPVTEYDEGEKTRGSEGPICLTNQDHNQKEKAP